ncbi:recombinase family protein, partial [Escherichia coli]
MALLGYARVSTSHQKLTNQKKKLKNAGVRED